MIHGTLFLLILSCVAIKSLLSSDMDVLQDFYNSMDSKGQALLRKCEPSSPSKSHCWDFTRDINGTYKYSDNLCKKEWLGLECDRNYRIQTIDFSNQPLHGTIPSSIGKLNALSNFLLKNASFRGTIPPELGDLTMLVEVLLSENRLTGRIPTSLGRMNSLHWISLDSNGLNGSVPTEFGSLFRIEELTLHTNQLSGTIPSHLGSASTLTSLNLHSNFIDGTIPSALSKLSKLVELNIKNNSIRGSIGEWLGNLTSLTTLELFNNRLTGSLPSSLAQLSKLEYLNVGRNKLSGSLAPLPPSILLLYAQDNQFMALPSVPPNIKLFEVRNNSFLMQPLPSSWPLSIVSLGLANNQFTSTIPATLALLSNLESLDLDDNLLVGLIPSACGAMTKLGSLSIKNNKISGLIPTPVGRGWSLLFTLNLAKNALSGTIPSALLHPFMYTLVLSENSLTGAIPSLFNATRLLTLRLDQNFLTTFATSVIATKTASSPSRLRAIQTIDVSSNFLREQLPDSLFLYAPFLESFVASKNCFSGSIPSQVCTAVSLKTLILDGMSISCKDSVRNTRIIKSDRITDGLPACVVALPKLQTLHLSGLGLKGPIPFTPISPNLFDLSLSHNLLTGQIPLSLLERVNQLTVFDLSYNKLQGNLEGIASPNPNGQFKLLVNRLSNYIPTTLMALAANNAKSRRGNSSASTSAVSATVTKPVFFHSRGKHVRLQLSK